MTAGGRAIARPAEPSRASFVGWASFAAAVFMLLVYSQGWVRPLTGGGDESQDSALIRALYLPAYAAAVGLMALGPLNVVRATLRQPFVVALMLIAAFSYFWSVSPDQTERRIFALAFTTLGALVLAARYRWAELAEVMAAAFAILAVASVFTGLFVPSIGRMSDTFPGSWRGLWIEKNSFGGDMAQGSVICAAAALLNVRRARLWLTMAAIGAGLVLLSTSKTSLISLMLGFAALGLVWLVRRGPIAGVAGAWITVVALAAIGGVIFFASDVIFNLLGKDATLTGRTKIWAGVWREIQERPWQGWGYGAIWDETDDWGPLAWITKVAGFRAHHAHNSWLEQWLALGIPGLAAWIGLYLQTLAANIVALYRSKGAYLALPFFIVYSMTTLTESIAVIYNDLRWVIFVALAAKLALPDAPAPPPRPAARPTLQVFPGGGPERSPK